jgi:uncharacterized membrane protein YeiH
MERSLFVLVDLLGTFAFATSGAAAAKQRRLDWFGVFVTHPVKLFDLIGLGFFAVVGAHQSLRHGAGVEAAITLGAVTAVGGGVMRDLLLNRVPAILEREIYAVPALVAAVIQVIAELEQWPLVLAQCIAVGTCLVIRLLALRYSWALPVAGSG